MEPVVRYATREDLPRVNELRQQVSELHAAGRPDIFRPGFCEALQQHAYQLFDAPETACWLLLSRTPLPTAITIL